MYRLGLRRRAGPTQQDLVLADTSRPYRPQPEIAHPASAQPGGTQPGSAQPGRALGGIMVDSIVRIEPTTSPLTGLASVGMLTLALEQVYEHCRQRQVRPSEAFALLVLQAEFSDRSTLVRDALRVMVADELRRAFTGGETTAEVGNRFVILAAHTSGLRRTGLGVLRRLRRVPALKVMPLDAWIQPLPDHPGELTRFVLEIGL